MALDDFLDKTVWRAGRGAKRAKDTFENVKDAPKRAINRQFDRITPKCTTEGGSLQCKLPKGKKRGRGTTCERCGNEML